MKLKIMITGKNKKIALDLAGHLEGDRGYKVIKCEASMDTLFDAVQKNPSKSTMRWLKAQMQTG